MRAQAEAQAAQALAAQRQQPDAPLPVEAAEKERALRAGEDREKAVKLSLSTGYSEAGYPARILLGEEWKGPAQLTLSVTLDGKGGGEGTLALDPNQKALDSFGKVKGGTLLGFEPWKVTFKQVEAIDDGSRLYEIEGQKSDRRLSLLVPPPGATTYRLIVADKDGRAREVILLQAEASR
jgi:hypothetical protein